MTETTYPCNASMLLVGPSKVGKTTLACSGPQPTLILDAEGGTRFIPYRKVIWSNPMTEPPEYDGTWDVCVVYVRSFQTFENVYQWLHSGAHPFRVVVVDSISESLQRAIDSIAGQQQMTTPGWGDLLRRMSALIRQFRDLLIHPINPLDAVVFTAMERVTQDGVHVPWLQGQIANVIAYYIDLVLYMNAGPNEETGVLERKLLTKPHPQYLAGDRTGRLPTIIIDPTLNDILALACDVDIVPVDAVMPDLTSVATDEVAAPSAAEVGAPGEAETTNEDNNKETTV